MSDWEAHLSEGPDDWAARCTRLVLCRRLPNGAGEQIVGWTEGGLPLTEAVLPGAVLRPGFRVPREALASLRDAIDPGPSAAEVRRLEEALAVERARVDALTGVAAKRATQESLAALATGGRG